MNKREIRKNIFELRKSMTGQEHADYSFGIFNQIKSLKEYQNAKIIYAYYDVNNEAGTELIINDAISKGKQVALPKIEEGIMNFYGINSIEDVQPGYYNIPEPKSNTGISAPDIVIVPGVSFSHELDRLGYGGGFYDSFLARHKECMKIAIAFEFQMRDNIPVEKHDIKMDMIITEKKIYKV